VHDCRHSEYLPFGVLVALAISTPLDLWGILA
jgi:hypothetical protein